MSGSPSIIVDSRAIRSQTTHAGRPRRSIAKRRLNLLIRLISRYLPQSACPYRIWACSRNRPSILRSRSLGSATWSRSEGPRPPNPSHTTLSSAYSFGKFPLISWGFREQYLTIFLSWTDTNRCAPCDWLASSELCRSVGPIECPNLRTISSQCIVGGLGLRCQPYRCRPYGLTHGGEFASHCDDIKICHPRMKWEAQFAKAKI